MTKSDDDTPATKSVIGPPITERELIIDNFAMRRRIIAQDEEIERLRDMARWSGLYMEACIMGTHDACTADDCECDCHAVIP